MIVHKNTTGFVVQRFDTETRKFIDQEFVASDQVDYEDDSGNAVDTFDEYLPFNMMPPNGTVTVLVEGGCVQDVVDLPDGWNYQVDDHDGDCCEVCGRSENIVGPLSSNAEWTFICDECAEKGTE
jgi:hypothetical protein